MTECVLTVPSATVKLSSCGSLRARDRSQPVKYPKLGKHSPANAY